MKSGRSAGFWRRLAALVYDAVLVAALWMAYTGAALLLSHGRALLSEGVGFWVYPYRLGLVLVLAAYCILNWMRSGQTLGMRAWHLQAADANGRRLRLQQAALRFVLSLAAWTPAALGVLWLYLDRDHLALHDRLSRTRVVHLTGS